MQARFWTVALLGFVLVAMSACGGSSGPTRAELQDQVQSEREARIDAEERAATEKKKREEEEAARITAEEKAAADAAAKKKAADDAAKAADLLRETEEQRKATEAERQRLANEAERARQAAVSNEAEKALMGLKGTRLTGLAAGVMGNYRAPATVSGFPTVTGRSSGKWYITTGSQPTGTEVKEVTVYTDVGPAVPTPIQDVYDFTAPTDGYRTITVFTAGEKLRSSRFPSAAGSTNIPLTVDDDPDVDGPDGDENTRNDYVRTAWFSGSYHGAPGQFQCAGTGDDACKVTYTGRSYTLTGGTWTFRTSPNAKAQVADTQYMTFGWWRDRTSATGAYEYGAEGAASNMTFTSFGALEGTATYRGPAIGHYAVYQDLDKSSNNHGPWKANAQLTAHFGDTSAGGSISGTITGFDVNSGWAVTLKETTISVDGTITEGTVSWAINGDTKDGGAWNGKFHADVDTHVDTYPDGVTGSFDASFGASGEMIGAFGAHKQ